MDGGAVAADGTIESGLNLTIAEKTADLFRLCGISPVLTRCSETLPYPDSLKTIREKKVWDQNHRVELINSVENAVLISIHQNNYPDSRPNGPQVFYGSVGDSEALAALAQEKLNEFLCPGSRRLASKISPGIYLMKCADCPSILVECGFLSNPEETAKLKTETYQSKLALILVASYLEHLSLIN